jgi:8-oxo-dGTP diphosphatase
MKKKKNPVVAVIGVVKKESLYLLTKRRSPKSEWNKWQFPGGGLEFGEKIDEAVKRELKEETGVDVKITKRLDRVFEIIHEKDKFHGVFFVFLCQMIDKNQKIKVNNEASDFGWFTKEGILQLDSLQGTKEIINEIESSID